VRVEHQLSKLFTNNYSSDFISKEKAEAIVQSLDPKAYITNTEEESLHDKLVYVVEVYKDGNETDVYIDRTTGNVLVSADEGKEVETFNDVLINDFEENLLWANVMALVLTFFLSYFLAGATLRPIQKKMKQQEQFSVDVAHEIRTPLAAILGAADSVLMKEETVHIYQQTLLNIKKEGRRLNDLIEDLLATARNTSSTEFVKVDLSQVVISVTQRLTEYAHKKGIQCNLMIKQGVFIFGNEIMLERMVENVVHNAIKFSHNGGTIEIILTDTTMSIKDIGIGMSPETKIHIFERFYTADSSRNEYNKNGVGLGLSIVRQIADLHKIRMHVDSELGQGTVFTFSFLQ
jgi:signal transduction histidine kinase